MKRRIPESTWQQVRVAHASGIGLREIARTTGIPAGTVLARARREGWTRQIADAKAIVEPCQAPSPSVSTAAAVSMAERGQRHLQRVAGITEKVLPLVESWEPGAILDRVEDFDRLDKIARRTYGLDIAPSNGHLLLLGHIRLE